MRFRVVSIFCLLVFLTASFQGFSGIIKGNVYDLETGEPVAGASIYLGNKLDAISGLDGSFVIRNLRGGSYTILITHKAYQPFDKTVAIAETETFTVTALLQLQTTILKDVVITGHSETQSEIAAHRLEHAAPQIMNIVSSQAIEKSPDVTVADVVQRVSGVSVEQSNSGSKQYALVRGMDKRYNYTLINGIKIPGPDKEYRYVPLDIFPAELLGRLEVYKTLTPSMEADATGGAVNMVMKDAPETLSISANIGTGYSGLFLNRSFTAFDYKEADKKSPYELHPKQYNATVADFSKAPFNYQTNRPLPDFLAGLSAGDRFFKNRLGVLFAGSIQNINRGANSVFFESSVVDTLKGVTLTSMKNRKYSNEEQHYGLYAKTDYRFDAKNKLQWNNALMGLTDVGVRDSKATLLTIGGYDKAKGNATLEYSTRARITDQQIFNSTLQGDHLLAGDLKLNWSAVYSIAKRSQPDNTTITLNGEQKNFVSNRTNVEDAASRWERNSDRDIVGYLNLSYTKPVRKIPVQWTIGTMYRDKLRHNFYNNYNFRPVDPFARYGVDFDDYTQIQWIVENPRGSVGTSLNYTASEKIAAGFFQFKGTLKKIGLTGGVRVESTDQGFALDFPIGESRPYGKQLYTDILPSLNLNYKPGEKVNLRASYFKSLNRPGFFEIAPYTIVNEEYVERGNPDLKHALIDNLDIRYEAFPNPAEQFMAGVFYKHLENPIEYTLQPDSIRGQDIYYMPGNFGNATNFGGEIDYIKYFNKLGIKFNYTYTHSRITTAKSKRIRDENGDLKTITVNQTRPLYGQSAHISNASFLYKDAQRGWDAQLTFQYTGQRINTVSQFVDNDLWQKAFIQADASLEKMFKNRFSIFLKANNLLNTPVTIFIKNGSTKNAGIPYQDKSGETLIRQNFYQQFYYIGFRYKW